MPNVEVMPILTLALLIAVPLFRRDADDNPTGSIFFSETGPAARRTIGTFPKGTVRLAP